jgi:hypothetical protein
VSVFSFRHIFIYLFKYTPQARNNSGEGQENLCNLSMKKWEKRTTIIYSEILRWIPCLISSLLKAWLQTESCWSSVGDLLNSIVARIKNDFCLITYNLLP